MKKGESNTTPALDWVEANNFIARLLQDEDYFFALLVGIGIYGGTRISETLKLTKDNFQFPYFHYTRGKRVSGKNYGVTRIKMSESFWILYQKCSQNLIQGDTEHFFTNRDGTIITTQYANRTLKTRAKQHGLMVDYERFSSHSLRKTFGKRFYDMSEDKDKALHLLMIVFKHTSIATTMVYIGVGQEQIDELTGKF